MIWFALGFGIGYLIFSALIAYEFQEFLLDINRPEMKSKPWGK